MSAPSYLMTEEQFHLINRALLTAISVAGLHAPGVQRLMVLASTEMDAIADAPSREELIEKLEAFAEVGEILSDDDGWSGIEELSIEADPHFGPFATIKAAAFRDAFQITSWGKP